MRLNKLAVLLEILFWKISIPVMSVSSALLAIVQPVMEQVSLRDSKIIISRLAVIAGSGLTLGFMLGLLRALIW